MFATAQHEIARLTAQLSLADRLLCFVYVKFGFGSIPSPSLRVVPVIHERALTEMVASSGKGRARSFAFEHQVRSLLASAVQRGLRARSFSSPLGLFCVLNLENCTLV